MRPYDIFSAFLYAINKRNLYEIRYLLTNEHRFIDSLGNIVQGADGVFQAWAGYFQLFPAYTIRCEDILEQGNTVIGYGRAIGQYSPNGSERYAWEIPAAFVATIEGRKIAEWRVFADNEPVRRIMANSVQ